MKVAVIGTGYVGLVSGSCLADLGHEVWCVDTDLAKIQRLEAGEIPIFEPGLEELVKRNRSAGRLRFTTSYADAITGSEVISIAVGTPSASDGSVDMQYVFSAMRSIGEHLKTYAVIADKSTVPVGTAEQGTEVIRGVYQGEFDVVSNPEFLREGHAVMDFMHPPRIVIGSASPRATEIMHRLYASIDCQKIVMSVRSAELTKYASKPSSQPKLVFSMESRTLPKKLELTLKKVPNVWAQIRALAKNFYAQDLDGAVRVFQKMCEPSAP